jgi:hypothetical protein
MSKPRTIQGTPDEPESTIDVEQPEDVQADRTSAEALLSPNTTKDPTIINRQN